MFEYRAWWDVSVLVVCNNDLYIRVSSQHMPCLEVSISLPLGGGDHATPHKHWFMKLFYSTNCTTKLHLTISVCLYVCKKAG